MLPRNGFELREIRTMPGQKEPMIVRALLPQRLLPADARPRRRARVGCVHLRLIAQSERIVPADGDLRELRTEVSPAAQELRDEL